MWLWVVYILVVATIFCLSYIVSYLAHIWEHKSKLSSSIICGLIVGFITGMPELIVNITSAASPSLDSNIGAGDVMGSNLLNLAFLGVGAFIFYRYFKKIVVTKTEIINVYSLIGIYTLYAIGFGLNETKFPQIGHLFSIISIVAFIVWVVNAYFLTKATKHKLSAHKSNFLWRMSIKKITILFVISAVLLIGASVGTTYICNAIINNLKLDKAFGGSVFVSLSTALPEIISCLALFHLKNPNAAVAEMLGSNIFNIFTLVINDLITTIVKPPKPLFKEDLSAAGLAIAALIGAILFLMSLLLLKWKRLSERWKHPLVMVMTGLTASIYPVYIIVCLTTGIYK